MRFVTFNESGRVAQKFNDNTVFDLPDGAHAVTVEQFNNAFDLLLVGDEIQVSPLPVEEPTIEQKRESMVLTAYQVRKQLNAAGIRQQVEDLIDAADIETKDAWMYASSFERNHPLIATMAALIPLTDEELDQMFIDGAKL